MAITAATSADERFLQDVTFHYQDGYAGRVLYAGHWSCAALHAGWLVPDLIEYGVREGLAGDLYPRDGVEQVVRSASTNLCPGAPRADVIRP
ncbi:hypothetical protein [Pseudonocardia sp. NPDC049154]|uniref:hypothetical protein n=1 Tax=Pseudonocardia sp. NPDC049154 TaxID=3155501 RepID=UPI0033CBA1AE